MLVLTRHASGVAMMPTHPDTRTARTDPWMGDNLIMVMWRGRWIMLCLQVLVLAATLIYLTRATPIYTSTSRVYVEQSGPKVFTEAEQGVMTQSKNFLYTQVELLKSFPILGEVVSDPAIQQMRTFAGFDNPAAYLKKNLHVEVGRRDDIIDVSFDSPHRHEAAQLVNAIVDTYLTYHAKSKHSTSAEILRILQLENASRLEELSTKRQALADFRQEHEALAFESDRGNVIMGRLERLSSELTEAQLATITSDSAYEHVKQMLADPAKLSQFVEVQRAKGVPISVDRQYEQLNATLHEFELRLANRLREVKAGHPAVTALEVEIANLKAQLHTLNAEFAQAQLVLAEQEYQAAKGREDKIAKHYADQCRQALELSREVDQYEMMRLDWEQTKTLCDALSSRIRELSVTDNVGALNISVLEVARVADTPSKPQKGRTMAIAQLMALMLGGVLVMLRDWMDQRLRSAEEVVAVLDTPVLGVVPSMPRRLGVVGRGQRIHRASSSAEAEAYRTIRTALLLGTHREEARRILVTSPAPGDGKSTLVSNLAIAMAQAGQKTLIVDADLRKPTQQRIFEMAHDEAGLSTVLSGQTALEEGIRATGVAGLALLPAGPHVPNPSEMLGGNRFVQLLEMLTTQYDRIIIDSPPVMSVTDAKIIAAVCDVTLLVLRAEKSRRSVSRSARDGLLHVGACLLGAIVNDVNKKARYGQYGGYAYGYERYAYAEDERPRIHHVDPSLITVRSGSYTRMKRLPARSPGSPNHQSQDFLELIRAYTQPGNGSQIDDHNTFTQKDCEEWTGLSRTTVQQRLGFLVGAGIIEVDRRSKPYQYRVTDAEQVEAPDGDLPVAAGIPAAPGSCDP